MSDNTSMSNTDSPTDFQEFSEEFDTDNDPLAEYDQGMRRVDTDPFEVYLEVQIRGSRDRKTVAEYERVYRNWKDHMWSLGRHPACPKASHVRGFLEKRDGEVVGSTLRQKIARVQRAYQFFQKKSELPHPKDFVPFEEAKATYNIQAESEVKDKHGIPLDEMRRILAGVSRIRRLLIIVLQLKTAARATATTNIKIADFHVSQPQVEDTFQAMGSNLPDEATDAIYIASSDERDGNKSENGRVIPLDDELRRLLVEYLYIRPSSGSPYLLLSHRGQQLRKHNINEAWHEVFRPEYGETEHFEGITSHFARHYFTTHFRIDTPVDDRRISYLRGDKGTDVDGFESVLDLYTHVNRKDVLEDYTDNIYRLGLI